MGVVSPRRRAAAIRRCKLAACPGRRKSLDSGAARGARIIIISPPKRDVIVETALFNARVEGFRVTERVVRDGRKLLTGKTTADELVQKYLRQYRRVWTMDEQLPDSDGVLPNRSGITDPEELKTAEAQICHIRMVELAVKPVRGSFDLAHLQRIHEGLFGDIYDFAGW